MDNPIFRCARTPEAIRLGVGIPVQSKDGDAGYDLPCVSWSYNTVTRMNLVHTGVMPVIPYGWCGLVFPRGSTVAVLGYPTPSVVIDSNYRGEITIGVYGVDREELQFTVGQRVAQLVLTRHIFGSIIEISIDEMPPSVRGVLKFGSSGR